MSSEYIRIAIREALEQTKDVIGPQVANLSMLLEARYPVSLFLYWNRPSQVIILSQIIIDKDSRGQGFGSKVLQEICDFADTNGLRIALTPSSDFGGSKTRLIKFYKEFGFKNYKGYEFRETMVREPGS